jgi:hypothetical protein
MTILISLMSDTFLAKFQESAKKFGVKGGEDERYIGLQKERRERRSKWKRTLQEMFGRRSVSDNKSGTTGIEEDTRRDMEKQDNEIPEADDYLREEMLEEVREIRRSVDEQVEARLEKRGSVNKRGSVTSGVAKATEVQVAGKESARRRAWRDLADDGDADDENDQDGEIGGGDENDEGVGDDGIGEDEVRKVIQENRNGKSDF